ncbi:MAG TPA: DUF4252 domain-containing protein [Rhodothermales bacterium]|nr:DUF4252 domain-containing protein [Rhodothermales bacterium]
MKRSVFLLGLVLATVWAGEARAQAGIERNPGYVNFADVESWFDQEATMEVNIKGALLKLVAEASRYDDPDLASMLGKLKAIQVRGYTLTPDEVDGISRRTSDFSRRLEGQGWDTVARVREDGEDVHMYVKAGEDAIDGLMVMVVAPGENETVFVNIVGNINPEEIGRIGRKFDIGPLDGAVVRERGR